MARSDSGWFAVPRDIMSPDKTKNIFATKKKEREIYILFLSWARWEPSKSLLGRQQIILNRGELVTSHGEISNLTGFSTQTVRTCVANLEKWEKINILTNTLGLHINVCNYEDIRKSFFETNMQSNRDLTGIQQGPNRDLTGTQQHNKKKEEEKRKGEEELIFNATTPSSELAANEDDPFFDPFPENQLPAVIPPKKPATKTLTADLRIVRTKNVWDAYRSIYVKGHGAEPPDNSKIRSQILQLINLVGEPDAIDLVQWYVQRERGLKGWLLAARHPFGELLKSYQTYLTNMKNGIRITNDEAQRFEQTDSNQHEFAKYLNKKAKQNQAEGSQTV